MAQTKKIGILSQTLSPSPSVRWILPARIRSKSQNDVVFVGENSVQLREALPNGKLADVTAKVELGAHILAAKLISARLEMVPVVEQILNQAREDDRETYVIDGEEIDDATPPQVVVLSLATNQLAFLFAKDVAFGKTILVYAKKSFLRDISLAGRISSHIAVDPESRAVAVSPTLGYLGIFALKKINEIHGEIRETNSNPSHIFKPSNQDRYLQVDGVIIKMDFLPSTETDANKVILLLLVSHNGSTSLLLYRWDTREGPRHARPMMCSGQRLPIEDALPLILIPSSRCPSFVIVTETHLAVYDNVISDQAKRISFPCRREMPVKYESSSVPPLWVQWAKPKRHAKYLETHDDFYLVREDGELRYYNVDHESTTKVNAHFSPGSLNINVDQAFAMLVPPAGLGADVFVAGGDLSDGGVWHCVARQTPVCVQILPNMAPVRDMLILGSQFSSGSSSGRLAAQRFFTCSGNDSRSSYANEIRFGLEADIGCSIEHEDASSVTNLWILEDRRPGRVLFLMSHPLHSSILSLDTLNLDVEVGDINTYPGIDLESPTLAAGFTLDGLTVQLTSDSMNICVLSQGPRRVSTPHLAATCVAASIEASGGCFVVALRSPLGFYLQMGSANIKMEITLGSQQYELPKEPAAVAVVVLGGIHVILAGLSDGTLLSLCADSSSNLHLLSSYNVQDLIPDTQSCTIGSVEVLSRPNALQGLVLCGLRTGLLVMLSMNLESNANNVKINVGFVEKMVLGSTSVSVVGEQGPTSAEKGALISCESDLRRISLLDEVGLQYQISQIWMTSHDDASASQPVVNAFSRIISHPAPDINGLLVCASETDILISSLTLHDTAVPRRHKISGPPEKLTYSKHLKGLVVGLNRIEVVSIFQNGTKPGANRRFVPHLELVDPEQEQAGKAKYDTASILKIGQNGDRIRALMEWCPADDTSHFELIAIGIDSDAPDHRLPSGRLLLVNVANVKKLPFGKLKIGTGSRYPGRPIYSLAASGLSSILVGAGKSVILENFDMKTRKLSTLATFELPSESTSLYGSESLAYATTLKHSLLILKNEDDKFKNLAADPIARNTKSALILDDLNLLNAETGVGTHLVGLAKNSMGKQEQVLFEARLPLVVEAMQRRDSGTESRHILDGVTMDGTIYRFKTLDYDEWKLLKFLEGFFRDDAAFSFKLLNPFLKPKQAPSPREMHVNGDLLALLIDEGPELLRTLLVRGRFGHVPGSPGVKTEEQKERAAEFTRVGVAVFGESEDLVADVVMWLRGLMRVTK